MRVEGNKLNDTESTEVKLVQVQLLLIKNVIRYKGTYLVLKY